MYMSTGPREEPQNLSVPNGAGESTNAMPVIDIYIAPGHSTAEDIQALLESLSDMHVAAGGLGLQFKLTPVETKSAE